VTDVSEIPDEQPAVETPSSDGPTQASDGPAQAPSEPAAPVDLDAVERDLTAVEVALNRLADGTYWTDEVTGQPIPDDALVRDPLARRV
jgi:RNA polymerase-binding transcription factor DksA